MANYFLLFLMLLSGLAGISYEILYARLLGNIIGDQFVVSASILMTFLLGIGWGSLLAHRLWRYLWLIEAAIGVYALAMVLAMPWLEMLIYSNTLMLPSGLTGSVIVCVILLCIPAALIGCSVPLFSTYLERQAAVGHNAFSQVYSVYNIGAAFTALAIEFYLIRWLGINTTVVFFAAINVVVAVGLYAGYSGLRKLNEVHQVLPSLRSVLASLSWQRAWPLILASMASAVFQLFMLKYAELVFGPFRESFALVLSIVLLGIVLGSLLVRYTGISFYRLMMLAVVSVLAMLLLAGPAIYLYAAIYELINVSYVWTVIGKWLWLAGLMLLPATAFGATIPALLQHDDEVSQESGALLFISSCANAAGFLLMVLVLHPLLDYGVQLLVVICLATLALLLAPMAANKPLHWRGTVVALLLLVVAGGVFKYQWDEDVLYLSYTSYHDVETTREKREKVSFPDRYKGYQDVFSINWIDDDPYFFINGYISIPLNNSSEKVVGGLSSLYAPRLDQALVLGLGSGATASTVGLFFDHTDVVEINPVVRDNLFRMSKWNYDIEHNDKVNIIVDDAIHDIKSRHKQYDLILNTVTTPLYFSSSKLYTVDFFKAVKQRLQPDGVYVTWMDSRIGDIGADIVLRSMKSSFPHCALLYIKSSYFLLVASDKPILSQQGEAVVNHQLFKEDMMNRYDIVSEWLPYQLLTSDAYQLIGEEEGEVNSSDHPVLEYEMAHLRETGMPQMKRRLSAAMALDDIAKSAGSAITDAFPADAVKHADQRIGNSMLYRRLNYLAERSISYSDKKDLAELARRKLQVDVEPSARNLHRYGYQLMQVNRDADAIAVFDRTLALDPNFKNASYNKALVLEKMGKISEAEAAYRAELVVDPEDIDALYRLGRLLYRQGQYQKSLDVFEQAISDNRQYDVARNLLFYRSLDQKALGQLDAAAKSMKIYLDRGGIEDLSKPLFDR